MKKAISALSMVLAFLSGPPRLSAKEPVRIYPTMTDAFMAGMDQHKFVLIFFHDGSTARHPNTDVMWPVAQRVAGEALIQHHTVLGDVDLARDEGGAAVARNLNQHCATAGCPSGEIAAPTLSLFLPDSKNIAEIARLVGVQRDYTIRNLLVERMCESIARKDLNSLPMDDELAGACRGVADSSPSSLLEGWRHVEARASGFAIDLPGIPREYDRKIDMAGAQTQAHYVTFENDLEISTVTALAFHDSFDPNAALRAYRRDLPARGKVQSANEVRFAGYPALRYSIEPNNATRIEGIYVVAGQRTYDLAYQSSNNYLSELTAEEIFDSFRLSTGQ